MMKIKFVFLSFVLFAYQALNACDSKPADGSSEYCYLLKDETGSRLSESRLYWYIRGELKSSKVCTGLCKNILFVASLVDGVNYVFSIQKNALKGFCVGYSEGGLPLHVYVPTFGAALIAIPSSFLLRTGQKVFEIEAKDLCKIWKNYLKTFSKQERTLRKSLLKKSLEPKPLQEVWSDIAKIPLTEFSLTARVSSPTIFESLLAEKESAELSGDLPLSLAHERSPHASRYRIDFSHDGSLIGPLTVPFLSL